MKLRFNGDSSALKYNKDGLGTFQVLAVISVKFMRLGINKGKNKKNIKRVAPFVTYRHCANCLTRGEKNQSVQPSTLYCRNFRTNYAIQYTFCLRMLYKKL